MNFIPGQKVLYVPTHARGDVKHRHCELGTVVRISEEFVFVLYSIGGPKATYPDTLYIQHECDSCDGCGWMEGGCHPCEGNGFIWKKS